MCFRYHNRSSSKPIDDQIRGKEKKEEGPADLKSYTKKKLDFTMQHTKLYWNITEIEINARKIDLYLYTSKELRSSEGLHI